MIVHCGLDVTLQGLGHVRKDASLLWIKHAALIAQKVRARSQMTRIYPTSSAQGLSLVHCRLQGLGHVRKGASLLWIKHAALIIHFDHRWGCAVRHIQPPPLEANLGQNLHH